MRTLVKTALCGAYKYSGVMPLQEAIAASAGRSFLAVLLFHRVTDEIPEDGLTVSVARFRGICRFLRRSFRVVPLAEIFRLVRAGGPFPRRTVAITFDDSYRDNLDAARIMAECGLPGCFFIPSGFIDTERRFSWDDPRQPLANLSWDEVREMIRLGHEIGSHTVNHPDLATVPPETVRRELVESKKRIEAQLGQAVRWFTYPFGGKRNFSADLVPLVVEAGYEGCLSGYGGFIYPQTDDRILPREPVPYFPNNLNLELHLSGCLHWFYGLKRRLGLLRPYEGPARSNYDPAVPAEPA